MTRQGMKIEPLAWKDKPALIEVAFPAQKISIEAQCERKANSGQTLTAIGSYWKGRKPLVLVRACVLGALLPSTGETDKDLEVFEMLMAIDDGAFERRIRKVTVRDIETWGSDLANDLIHEDGKWKVRGQERTQLLAQILRRMPYNERLQGRSLRPEELPDEAYELIWTRVNDHLGTTAQSHAELVRQLGILRFGRAPIVADAFCGGGAIPFEAARLGCDVRASDLNPIACMLTWGALNIVGADGETQRRIQEIQESVATAVNDELMKLGIEHDELGNRAKSYLYCVEAICPQTGWRVPLAPSWIISHSRRCVAVLVPDHAMKRFELRIESDVDSSTFERAKAGTVRGGDIVFVIDDKEFCTPLRTLRGDRRVDGAPLNSLRLWENTDVAPRPSDVFQERLYCIQWNGHDGSVFFREPTPHDLDVEARTERLVTENLLEWQREGLIPNMAIERGYNTDQPIRERGWTYWHHLFRPRELLVFALWRKHATDATSYLTLALLLDLSSKLCQWLTAPAGKAGGPRDLPNHVFYNQALNPFFNFAVRSFEFHRKTIATRRFRDLHIGEMNAQVSTRSADEFDEDCDLAITDPPYADAINYHEITDFFISWLRSNPPGANLLVQPHHGIDLLLDHATEDRRSTQGERFDRLLPVPYVDLDVHAVVSGH